ncbi:hypothetical protein LSH36_254g02001 [Paralvinella palmiformis]|uniref:Uncharacterized protein n=1 Tax=Paralvinella palmiformis TaxID=53620 RepID=A0AAD9JKS2_9ANNE|nr:hypothetical protein LSH36_254g02001 [Paralvinella palmiformis]
MASPRDPTSDGDGAVIIPSRHYRPTTQTATPRIGIQTPDCSSQPQESSQTATHMPGTHGLAIHNGGHITLTRRPIVQNVGHTPDNQVPGGNQIPDTHRPPTVAQNGGQQLLESIPEHEYTTMADRLLALRANQRMVSCPSDCPSRSVTSSGNDDSRVTTHPMNVTSRHVVTTSHGESPTSGTVKRSRKSGFIIKVFTTVSFLIGLSLIIISIAFLTRAKASHLLHDVGLVLVVISSILLVTAIVVYLFYRFGVCVSSPDRPRQINPIQKTTEPTLFRPEPAPGYHTPLPFGPVAPGYIPPQILFSQYAKKSFNHREIISGVQSPLETESLEDLPSEFRAFSMKTPRDANTDSPVAGPSVRSNLDRR